VYHDNQKAIEGCKLDIINLAVDRLVKMATGKCPTDPRSIVEQGWRDPVSPFIKDEPHPQRKWSLGKWRIVTCVSLVDQIVERCIYGRVVFAVKSVYPSSPAVIGIGFTDAMAEEFAQEVKRTFTSPSSNDVSGWDTKLGGSYIEAAGEYVIRAARSPPPAYASAVRNHIVCNVNPLFIIKTRLGSELYTRNAPGGMLSGSYVTTLYNTLCRIDVALLAGATMVKAAGDDTVEEHADPTAVVDNYKSLGFNVRFEPHNEDFFEFCSHRFSLKGKPVYFSGWRKSCLRFFLNGKFDAERLMAIFHELRNNPEQLAVVKRLLRNTEPSALTSLIGWDETKSTTE
jgi:hypothetical protein